MKQSVIYALLSLLVVAFVACETNSEPAPTPEQGRYFEVDNIAITRGSVSFDVIPAELDMDYLCVVMERSEVDNFTRDEFMVESIFMEIEDEASNKGKTLREYMPEVVDRGVIEGVVFSGLKGDTEYYILLFGVDAASGYVASTAVEKVSFRTADVQMVECDFGVKTTVKDNSVTMDVAPTDMEVSWYLCTMPAESYSYYVEDTEGPQMSQGYLYEYYFQQEINGLLEQGYSEQMVVDALIHRGALTLEAKGLQEHTEYYYLIAGLIIDGDGIVICTDVQRGAYTTEGAAQSSMTFEIEVWDIGQMEVSFSITPSNNNDKYCALVAPWDGVTEAQDMMHNIVEQWGGWMDVMANDRGPVKHSGATAMKLPAADTYYYIIAFGYDGGITTPAAMATFRTLPGGSLEEVQFGVSASSVTPYGFTMNVTSSDNTIYYVPGLCRADEYDEESFIKYENEAFSYYFQEYQKFNPVITVAELLDQYYYNGNSTLQVSGLQPDTEYLGYIYALDVHTGEVVKCFTFPNFVRTSTFSSITPTVEVVGYYSGDDENGAIFDDAAATKGRALTVVKYTGLEDVRTLFTAMVDGDCSNAAALSDGELWQLTAGYWQPCSVKEPYSFYLSDWNVVRTALCYATDNSGMLSAMSRAYTCPTAENKGDIEELISLVAEINAGKASVYSVPQSVVVDSASKTKITIIPIE